MKKTHLLLLVLTPVWLSAQTLRTIELVSTSGSRTSFQINNISKQTFVNGSLVTAFNDDVSDQSTALSSLNKIKFEIETDVPTQLMDVEATDYILYPIPVSKCLNLKFDTQHSGKVVIQLLSLDGRVQNSSTATTVAGQNQLCIATYHLNKGIYICRIFNGSEAFTKQIIKQ